MNILVTGAKGMVGTALVNNLKNIRDGKNKTRNIKVDEIYEFDLNNTEAELDEFTIVPETEGSELNAREAYQMISGAIDNEAADVDLGSNPKAYKEADVTRDSSELQNMVNLKKLVKNFSLNTVRKQEHLYMFIVLLI